MYVNMNVCHYHVNNKNCFICYSFIYTFCINHYISLQTYPVFTQDWLNFTNPFACLGRVNTLINLLIGEFSWLCLFEISIIAVMSYSCSVVCGFLLLVFVVILSSTIICKQVFFTVLFWFCSFLLYIILI